MGRSAVGVLHRRAGPGSTPRMMPCARGSPKGRCWYAVRTRAAGAVALADEGPEGGDQRAAGLVGGGGLLLDGVGAAGLLLGPLRAEQLGEGLLDAEEAVIGRLCRLNCGHCDAHALTDQPARRCAGRVPTPGRGRKHPTTSRAPLESLRARTQAAEFNKQRWRVLRGWAPAGLASQPMRHAADAGPRPSAHVNRHLAPSTLQIHP